MGGTKRGLMGSADTGVLAWAGWLVWLGWSGLRRGRRIGLACRAGWAGRAGAKMGLFALCLFTWKVSHQLRTVNHIPIKHYVNIAKRTVSALSFPPCRGGAFFDVLPRRNQERWSTILGVLVVLFPLPNIRTPEWLMVSRSHPCCFGRADYP